ncbi:DivIVA domain-containing protein [Micromonospora okii]|uniref:DivIVA domain-containing protein n=1 Tax=Micromonospora okii TaxID=1182970 RepID=UPI001E5498F5|nr:DivIVA domain-containing protein [Micromonospora okii]
MGQVLLLLVVALTAAAVVFGVTVLVAGRDPGLAPVEPDGRSVPLPASRPLRESDVAEARFDTAPRGYRMAQVDQALRRAAYDIGYKSELIGVLEAEVTALREGRVADADELRRTREQAVAEVADDAAPATPADSTLADSAPAPSVSASADSASAPAPAVAATAAGASDTLLLADPAASGGDPAGVPGTAATGTVETAVAGKVEATGAGAPEGAAAGERQDAVAGAPGAAPAPGSADGGPTDATGGRAARSEPA